MHKILKVRDSWKVGGILAFLIDYMNQSNTKYDKYLILFTDNILKSD